MSCLYQIVGFFRNLNDAVDYLIRSSRANSVSRLDDPYYGGVCSSLSYWPMATVTARETTPFSDGYTAYKDVTPMRAR